MSDIHYFFISNIIKPDHCRSVMPQLKLSNIELIFRPLLFKINIVRIDDILGLFKLDEMENLDRIVLSPDTLLEINAKLPQDEYKKKLMINKVKRLVVYRVIAERCQSSHGAAILIQHLTFPWKIKYGKIAYWPEGDTYVFIEYIDKELGVLFYDYCCYFKDSIVYNMPNKTIKKENGTEKLFILINNHIWEMPLNSCPDSPKYRAYKNEKIVIKQEGRNLLNKVYGIDTFE